MIIYKTTNLINGKFYIGKDKKNDSNYLGSGKILINAIKKYGKENFKKEILEHCNSERQLDKREIFWIKKLNACDCGYNIAKGGEGGDTISNHPNKKEIGEKHSQWLRENKHCKGRKRPQSEIDNWRKSYGNKWKGKNNYMYGKSLSEETKEKIGKANTGKTHTEETKKKISEKIKGENNPFYGKKHSEETKRKMSETKLGKNNPFYGKTHTDEVKQKIREINSKPKTEEHKRNISEALKGNTPSNSIKVIVDGILYNSMSHATRKIKIHIITLKKRIESSDIKYKNYRYYE